MSQSTSNDNPVVEDKAETADDIFEFLSSDDNSETESKEEKKSAKQATAENSDVEVDDEEEAETDEEEEESEEAKELKALEEELDDPDEDKLEASTPMSRREILKLYPDLFKKIPFLEKAYYREREFTKYFHNPADAEQAVKDSGILKNFEKDIIEDGNVPNILKLIKDHNPKTFNRVVDSYLDNLASVDSSAFHHVVGNVTKHIIANMYKAGKEDGDESLQEAAVLLNQYAFGSKKYVPPTKLSQDDPEEARENKAISEREKQLFNRALDNANEDVNGKVNNLLKINIEKNIDPQKVMPEYLKKAAIRDATEKVEELLAKDSRFKTFVDRAWEQAVKDNFSKTSLQRITDLYTAKAKALLAPVVKNARTEALKGLNRTVKREKKEEDEDEPVRQSSKRDSSERRLSSSKSKAEQIPAGMSTKDYLMQD